MSAFADRVATLCDLCASAFAFVVELQATLLDSRAAEGLRYDAVAARARDQLAGIEAAGRSHGFGKEATDQARYAITALLDEVVLASRGALRDEWLRRPLAAELFQEFNAGEEFFKRLDAMGRGGRLDPQVLAQMEVYATCLSLGFKGMHIDVSGAEKLRETLWSLTRRINEGRETTPLAPHWQQKESVTRRVGRLPTWLLVVAGLALIALLHGVSEWVMSMQAGALATDLNK